MAGDRNADATVRVAHGGPGPTRLHTGAELATPAGLKPLGLLDARFAIDRVNSAG